MDTLRIFLDLILILLFFLPPLSVATWLIVSIVRFASAPKDNAELRKKRKKAIILPAIIFTVMAAVIISFMLMLTVAITHM